MNCQDIKNKELIPEYLLGRLPEDQQKELQEHINSCKSCREEFEQEQKTFSGIQSYARSRMRQEIREQVDEIRERSAKTDWTLISKVAAVLFFLSLIPALVYYQYHFEPSFDEELLKPGKMEAIEEEILSGPVPESLTTDMDEKKDKKVLPKISTTPTPAPPVQPAEQPLMTATASSEGAGLAITGELDDLSSEPLSKQESAEERTEEEAVQTVEYTVRERIAASRSAAKPAAPPSKKSVFSSTLGESDNMNLISPILLEHANITWNLYLDWDPGSGPDKMPLMIIRSEERNDVYWKLAEQPQKIPVSHIQFIARNESTFVSIFPDSTRYILNLGKAASAVRIIPAGSESPNK